MGDPDATLSLAASQRAQPSEEARAGDRIGRFVITSRIGEGGMGVVLAGHDPDLNRPVAIKLLRTATASPGYRARLLREAQALARLHHPNVVSVYEVGADGDRIFIAMELVTGTTLTRWIEARRRPWREVVAMFLAVGEGVAAVHRAGMVHRDLKPDNVLVDDAGRARVADFGLARIASDDGEAVAVGSPGYAERLTRTGAVMGTPGYMAPEQQWGSDVDARADQYSFCVALRAALSPGAATGAVSPDGSTVDDRGPRAGANKPSPRDLDAVPKSVRDLIARGLAYDPADRFASMDELLGVLRAATASRRTGIAMVIGSTVLAFGVVAASIGIARSGRDVPLASGSRSGSAVVAVTSVDAAVVPAPPGPVVPGPVVVVAPAPDRAEERAVPKQPDRAPRERSPTRPARSPGPAESPPPPPAAGSATPPPAAAAGSDPRDLAECKAWHAALMALKQCPSWSDPDKWIESYEWVMTRWRAMPATAENKTVMTRSCRDTAAQLTSAGKALGCTMP
jgi:hypothetical protein